MLRIVLAAVAGALLVVTTGFGQSPLTVEKLWSMDRLGDPQISPDSTQVAFVATHYDVDENTSWRGIYVTSLDGADRAGRLVTAKGVNSTNPRFAPSRSWIAKGCTTW